MLAASLLVWTGCRLVQETVAVPQRTVQAVSGNSSSAPDPAVLQGQLMRFADDAISRSVRVMEEYLAGQLTQAELAMGMNAQLAVARTLVGLVIDPNPNVALLDAMSMSTLARLKLETMVSEWPDGARYQSMLNASHSIETNAWMIASDVLKPEQLQEMRAAVETWYRENPDPSGVILARPQEFAVSVRKALTERSRSDSGFFSLLTLDPMAGLDPAVREVTQTRLFAERALFAAKHAPRLVRWEIELLTLQLTMQPQIHTLISNSTSLTESVDRASRTVESLPDRISAERDAILNALKTQEGQLIALSAELKQTLEAGDAMSTSLNTTLTTFDALMKRFGVGEPGPEKPPDPNAKPFDILDYAKTAGEVAAMAQQIGTVLEDLNTTLDSPALDAQIAQLEAVSVQTTARVRSLLNHAALLVAGLILTAFGCALAFRKLGQKPKS